MFDIGFTEILIIAAITLIVVGPERMPEVVRAVSLWIGRFKRSLRDTRRELEQQLGADDIRRELHNEEIMRNLDKIQHDVSDTLNEEIDLEDDLYPPGHHNHDPNNDVEDNPVIGKTSNTKTGSTTETDEKPPELQPDETTTSDNTKPADKQ